MAKLQDGKIRVIAEVMGERYEVNGVADISEAVNTSMFKAAVEVDADLVTRKVKQELAAKLREIADKLEAEA